VTMFALGYTQPLTNALAATNVSTCD
jgi:hypothetical protein